MEKEHLQQLIDKVLSGAASAQERQELDNWYAAQGSGTGLTGELDETQKSVLGKELFTAIHQRIETGTQHGEEAVIYELPARQKSRTWMVAAAVLLIMISGALYFFTGRQTAAPAVLTSVIWKEEKAGFEIRKIRLPDGSAVWLNAGSSVRYDSNFAMGKREVWMQGEAYFDVMHAEGKSFEVHTGKITTRVLGTAFNIDAYTPDENITVTVKRGKVLVSDSVNDSGVLLPDQRAVYRANGHFERYDSVSADYSAWTTGQFIFHDMPFGEVATRLEKRFGIEIIFKDAGISNCHITASFTPHTSLNDMLDMLAITNGSKIQRGENPSMYFVYGKKQCK